MLANGGIPGEAQHPADREEIDTEKIALMMPEAPKKDKNGHLIAYYDVLDTPCGRILYQLAKYGFKLGISSRGTGDVITDEEGEECVDPSTYDFTCFDAVIIPSVKDARLTMVESLNKNSMSLKQALKESLDKANESDKKIMTEALKDLNIEIEEEEEEKKEELPEEKECNSEDCADKKEDESKKELKSQEAINDGTKEIINSLKEALKEKTKYEATIKKLQEELAVSNTKVNELEESCSRSKATIINLTSKLKEAKVEIKKVSELEESLKQKTQELNHLEEVNKEKLTQLKESYSTEKNKYVLEEKEHKTLQEKYNSLKENYDKKLEDMKTQLTESKVKQTKIIESLNSKVEKQSKLIERYRDTAYSVVEKYIKTKATMLGVSTNEIKNKLGESYTLEDIDKVCDNLRSYNLRMSDLPFSLNNRSVVKVKESINHSNNLKVDNYSDDDIDTERLSQMANLRDSEN